MNNIVIAIAQMNPKKGEVANNLEKALKFMDAASALNADLVCFPELMTCDYVKDFWAYGEEVPGPVSKAISNKSRHLKLWTGFGMPELAGKL